MDWVCQSRFWDAVGNEIGCNREATHDARTRCIFHAENKNADEFKAELRKIVQHWIDDKVEKWDFSGFIFTQIIRASDITPVLNKNNYPHFPVEVVFKGAQFLEYASFELTSFEKDVDFSRVEFKSIAEFGDVLFRKNVYFSHSVFNETAHFCNAVFGGNCSFYKATMIGDTILTQAKFFNTAYFNETTFKGFVDFSNSEFREYLILVSTTFNKESNFNIVTLHDNVYSDNASFAVLGDFNRCLIKGSIHWSWPGEGTREDKLKRGKLRFYKLQVEKGCELDFSRNILQDDTELLFEECDMFRIRLQGTDCTKITFYANEWPRKRGRILVGDDYLEWQKWKRWCIRSSVRWDLIAKTYQQLSRHFREDYDHEKANDFDRGVFEMRRLCPPIRNRFTRWLWGDIKSDRKWYCWRWPFRVVLHILKRYLSLTAFYRYISLYSGSILVPALLLMAVTLGFGLLYDHFLYGYTLLAFEWLRDVIQGNSLSAYSLKGIIAALRIVSLNRKWLTDEIDLLKLSDSEELTVTLIGIAQIIISAIIVTMLLFAVRRRFKH